MEIVRIVKLTFKESAVEDFKKLFQERKQKIRCTNGCNSLQLWNDEKDPCIFFTYSTWNSIHDLDLYRYSEFFKETWSIIKPWFKEKPEAWSVHNIETVS